MLSSVPVADRQAPVPPPATRSLRACRFRAVRRLQRGNATVTERDSECVDSRVPPVAEQAANARDPSRAAVTRPNAPSQRAYLQRSAAGLPSSVGPRTPTRSSVRRENCRSPGSQAGIRRRPPELRACVPDCVPPGAGRRGSMRSISAARGRSPRNYRYSEIPVTGCRCAIAVSL